MLKRIAKENVKRFGRLIGKLGHSDPATLFVEILDKVCASMRNCSPLLLIRVLPQIQVYENIIGPIVDAFKYLTPLAYDVLAFCLLEVSGQTEKCIIAQLTPFCLWLCRPWPTPSASASKPKMSTLVCGCRIWPNLPAPFTANTTLKPPAFCNMLPTRLEPL